MAESSTILDRPQRWDQPFGKEMNDPAVDRLLKFSPFSGMNPNRSPPICRYGKSSQRHADRTL